MTALLEGIDRSQLTALRRAETVIFNCASWHTPVGAIVCTMPDKSRVEIPCGASLRGGLTAGIVPARTYSRASYLLLYARQESQWVTVAHLLKPGDRLTLVFEPDLLTCAAMAADGWHADVFTLQVDRKGKRYFFYVGFTATKDGPGRMVR